jgi:GalNAc-alpha-(1->4)-GalNAc-alpha-(1->3)-diNAcBac-PP-undecaprenol alpha-1,4-N-acetyl-D-galactosaminyltransferase
MNKRICFIGGGLSGGGQERQLTGLANFYSKGGHKIFIINLFKTEQFFQTDKNIEIIWPEIERKKYHRLIYSLLIIPYLRKNIKKIKPDVILSFGEWFNPFVILATKFLKAPLFVLELMGPNLNLGWLIEISRKLTYKHANGVVVQTNIAAKIVMKKTGVANIAVIPNPVNVINANTSIKKNQIVSVGRLSREKGHLVLIRGFAMLPQQDWSLHIIGDGAERINLEKEALSLGISERVKFYGHQKDFGQILGESEIFVLPSFYEGFPNALIEAMSVPLACVSSDCVAGPGDIIDEGVNGLLVEPGNVEALASALSGLIENIGLRERLASEAYKIRETLAFDKIAKQYLDFFFKENE